MTIIARDPGREETEVSKRALLQHLLKRRSQKVEMPIGERKPGFGAEGTNCVVESAYEAYEPSYIRYLAIPRDEHEVVLQATFRQGHTRIRARVLYGMHVSSDEPMTPEQIAAKFNLPLEAVLEAITYCQRNPPEITQDFEREERLMDASGMKDPAYMRGGGFRVVPSQEVARS